MSTRVARRSTESRVQELTEALWSYADSPWHDRIDMLGEHGRKQVSQAAWIRSLLATFIKKWESPRVRIGGLFGAPAGASDAVLPWTRSQQSAFLILVRQLFEKAVAATDASWATSLREAEPDADGDPAFRGSTTLPNTDQGVRALLAVVNDLCYVKADELDSPFLDRAERLQRARRQSESEMLSSDQATQVGSDLPLCDTMTSLARYDWRTFSAPNLAQDARSAKARFRGSTGYRELRQDLLSHLRAGSGLPASTATEVLALLGWN